MVCVSYCLVWFLFEKIDDLSGLRASELNMRDIQRMLLRCVDIDDGGPKHWKAKLEGSIELWLSSEDRLWKVIECKVALFDRGEHSPIDRVLICLFFFFITDAYKNSEFLTFLPHPLPPAPACPPPLSSKNCFQIFFFSVLLSFFFVYIGREYTCYVCGYAYCISARLAPILQLWVDRIVWERCHLL